MSKKALAFAALLLSVLISAIFLPVAETLLALFDWVDANRNISWLVFIVFYVLATFWFCQVVC